MDIKWKKYSYAMTTKIIAFIIAVLCFSGAITIFLDTLAMNREDLSIAFEKSYFLSKDYINLSNRIVEDVVTIAEEYKNEEYILNGGTVTEEEIAQKKEKLFNEFQNTDYYNHDLTYSENYTQFENIYSDRIAQIKEQLIQDDLSDYRSMARRVNEYQGLRYYVKKGDTVYTNSPNQTKAYFKTLPSYMIFDNSEQNIFPEEIKENPHYYWVPPAAKQLGPQDVIYIGFSNEFINAAKNDWQQNKTAATNSLYQIAGLLLVLVAAFVYLILVSGRRPEKEQEIHLNVFDKIYNDINILACFVIIFIWFAVMMQLYSYQYTTGGVTKLSSLQELIFPVTLLLAVPGLILVLSLVKHIKNRTFIKHSLIYYVFYQIYRFLKDVYNSGNTAVKVVLIVVGYPIIAGLTFFMFPITLGLAAWLALKKVKEFNAVKEGVKQVKGGNLNYKIDIPGDGEFARLATDINSITDGLNKAVENEIKSERLKSELITNVSHDIRTPLTSIITYVDLLKNEKDQVKIEEYVDVIDQKSQRLKTLTDDLFEAAKASSGDIPVNFEKIDLVSLITQGLGEFDDKIQEHRLDFKISYPADKVYVEADGKLLWRAIENLLLNIFKYALEGSRVYVDIIDSSQEVTLIIKNISAYELNISADELMERFKRGDLSRSSQGSGLGLSIAKSLIEIQKGSFGIEIDGDLFKAVIRISKYNS